MDSLDISDLAYSLSNFAVTNDILSNTDPTTAAAPDIDVTPDIPEMPTIVEPVINSVNEAVVDDDYSFIYIAIGIVVVLLGIFIYNYYTNKNKRVQFQDQLEYEGGQNYGYSDL